MLIEAFISAEEKDGVMTFKFVTLAQAVGGWTNFEVVKVYATPTGTNYDLYKWDHNDANIPPDYRVETQTIIVQTTTP